MNKYDKEEFIAIIKLFAIATVPFIIAFYLLVGKV